MLIHMEVLLNKIRVYQYVIKVKYLFLLPFIFMSLALFPMS